MRKKIVLTHLLAEEVMESLGRKFIIEVINSGEPKIIKKTIGDAKGLIIRIGFLDRETIMSFDNLEVIGRAGVGVDNIDLMAANEKGIPVVVTPGANTRSVAEHSLALIFALSKDLKISDIEMHKGNYNIRNYSRTFKVLDKKLGIIGFGNIGQEIARLCSFIGMKIIIFDPFVSQETVKNKGFKYTEQLNNLLKEADIISINVPLTKDTFDMISFKEFEMMKQDVIIVNCARGGIINEGSLIKALEMGKIGGAGLDVFSCEPLQRNHPILKFDNVITTPHIGGLTKEDFLATSKMVAEGVEAILNGKDWPHIANKEVYQNPKWKKRN